MTVTERQRPSVRTDAIPPIVAVLRAADARRYQPVVDVLVENGVEAIELTMSTPGTLDAFADIKARAVRARVGIGTVTTADQMRQVLAIGADFVVTPTTDVRVLELAVDAGVPVYPGGLTPTELWTGWSAGATAVKVFPASLVGPEYVAHLRGPFPGIEVMPSGGVGMADAAAWIRAGACAVSVGGPLIGDALRGGDLSALARRCGDLTAIVADAKAQR
jgi:2-dehydro-3-deoxyphosphogluconate aldolase / (4S)-4-hydroxy-2-oxoglutarate aldolase